MLTTLRAFSHETDHVMNQIWSNTCSKVANSTKLALTAIYLNLKWTGRCSWGSELNIQQKLC